MGVKILQNLPETPERMKLEISLQINLGVQLMTTKGYGSHEAGEAFTRALALCRKAGESYQIFPAMWGLARNSLIQEKLQVSYELGEQLLATAEKTKDPEQLLQSHFSLAASNFWLGKPGPARSS